MEQEPLQATERGGLMSHLAVLARILSPSARRSLVVLGVLTALSGLVELVGVSLLIPFIAFASKMNPFGVSQSILKRLLASLSDFGIPPSYFTFSLGLIFLAGIAAANLCLCLYQYYAQNVVYTLKAELSANVARVISRRSITWYDQQNSGELSKSLMTDVAHAIEFTYAAVQVFAIAMRGLVVYCFFLFAQPKLALTTAFLMVAGYWVVFHFIHRPLVKAGAEAWKSDAAMYRLCSELVGGARALKVTATGGFVVAELAQAAERGIQPQIMRNMPGFITRALLETFTVASVIALLVYFNFQDGNLANGLPMLSAYALAGVRLIPAVQQALNFMVQMRFYVPALERIDDLLTHEDKPEQVDGKPCTFADKVEVRELSYCYDEDSPVLKKVSFTIRKRQRVALIGETGAGKSTLVDLLLALRFANQGGIYIDSDRLAVDNCVSWRRLVGYVPQSIYLRDASISENVAFGIPKDQIQKERVELACRAACLHDFILSLPDGYATEVGERGVRLSGGQCQRVGIARALYHDPEVVIFDEATSALDNVTEAQVLEALDSLKGVKTLVVVAHRLNTVWDFDQLFVLEKGELVGQGTTAELLANCPTFQRLAMSQKKEV